MCVSGVRVTIQSSGLSDLQVINNNSATSEVRQNQTPVSSKCTDDRWVKSSDPLPTDGGVGEVMVWVEGGCFPVQ